MMPNIPLHSMTESSWMVPKDDSHENSLFILEQQEAEYNAHLDSISNIAAPEPIGIRNGQKSMSNAMASMNMNNVNMNHMNNMNMNNSGMNINMMGMMNGRTSTSPSRVSRSGRASSRRNQPSGTSTGTGNGTPVASTSNPTGAAHARRASYSRGDGASGIPASVPSHDQDTDEEVHAHAHERTSTRIRMPIPNIHSPIEIGRHRLHEEGESPSRGTSPSESVSGSASASYSASMQTPTPTSRSTRYSIDTSADGVESVVGDDNEHGDDRSYSMRRSWHAHPTSPQFYSDEDTTTME